MGKQGRQKFADVWANLTNLGKQFGLSAMAMGKKLKELGLRGEDGNPTAQRLDRAGQCAAARAEIRGRAHQLMAVEHERDGGSAAAMVPWRPL